MQISNRAGPAASYITETKFVLTQTQYIAPGSNPNGIIVNFIALQTDSLPDAECIIRTDTNIVLAFARFGQQFIMDTPITLPSACGLFRDTCRLVKIHINYALL